MKGRSRAGIVLGQNFWPLQVCVITRNKTISTEAACFRLSQSSEEPLVYSMAIPMTVFQFTSLSVQKGLPVPNYSMPFLNVRGTFILPKTRICVCKAFSKWCARK